MTLAQVQAAVAFIMALIVSWTGLMVAIALTLPTQTNRAETVLETAPKKCVLSGLGMLLLLVLGVVLLNVPNGLVKLLGIGLLLFLSAVLSVGAAGLSQLMGKRIGEMSGARTSFGALVRGGIVYSVAMLFPLIGWYLFLPVSAVCALGAGIQAIVPRRRTVVPPISAQPIFEGQGAV